MKRRFVRIFVTKKKIVNCAKPAQAICQWRATVSRSFFAFPRRCCERDGKGGRGEVCFAPAKFLDYSKMAEKTDKADFVSQNIYPSNQSLFPILGSQNKSFGTSRGFTFPCASSNVETQSESVDKGKLNWNFISRPSCS